VFILKAYSKVRITKKCLHLLVWEGMLASSKIMLQLANGKNIFVKATLEIIKDYSMDSLTPAVSGAGKHASHVEHGETLYG